MIGTSDVDTSDVVTSDVVTSDVVTSDVVSSDVAKLTIDLLDQQISFMISPKNAYLLALARSVSGLATTNDHV